MTTDVRRFRNEDLVLQVSRSSPSGWDDGRYERFLDLLCAGREFQKDAIKITLRYLLGGEYTSLRELARRNHLSYPRLEERYGSFDGMLRSLQLPDQLSATLDLATGTGKSYVLYGLAAIMMAEGVVDRTLVLCPSTTIEDGLIEKFRQLSSDPELAAALPDNSKIRIPSIIRANESIVEGVICVENYHATLEHVGSSIRDGLWGKGSHTLVLNDEAHHVANESGEVRKWKEFLVDPAFGFRYVVGASGTCYIGNEYFADVIYRYSLKEAMEQNVIKLVDYVEEGPQSNDPDERWQIIINRHEDVKSILSRRGILPLTIIVTDTISRCKDVGSDLRHQLAERYKLSPEEVAERVLVVHSGSPDNARLKYVDLDSSKAEWIVSVSMLNEGWDVSRVFQIVPHEERAFNSKLLIAQVLGRGLRWPKNWTGPAPTVTVFNHEAWAARIRHLVNEILEIEKRITSRVVEGSVYHFDLHQVSYEPEPITVSKPMEEPYKIFGKGYVDLATTLEEEQRTVGYEKARTGEKYVWSTTVRHQTYTAHEVAVKLHERLEQAYDPDSDDPNLQHDYTKEWTVEKLEEIVNESLRRADMPIATESALQSMLRGMGTLRRKSSQNVRYTSKASPLLPISTKEKPTESVSAGELRRDRALFFTDTSRDLLSEDQREFFDEVTDAGSGYRVIDVADRHWFKTPVNIVITDHEPEKRFVRELVRKDNAAKVDAWIKSTSMSFYEIEFSYAKGTHQKRGKFSPDVFIKIGNNIIVIEIKADDEIHEPSEENRKKNEFALEHFNVVNQKLEEAGSPVRYWFKFMTPRNFDAFFQRLRDGTAEGYKSELSVALAND